MKIIETISEQIKILERIERVRDAFPHLKINWETDIQKMDFSKLRTPINFGRNESTLRLEKINPIEIKNSYAEGIAGLLSYDLPNTLDLIELMLSGERIIPPIFSDLYRLIDGKKMAIEGLSMFDGSHRLWVSSQLNLEEIPILRFDRIQEYCFTPKKWKFDQTEDGRLIVKSISGNKNYIFDTNNISIAEMNPSYISITEF